MPKRSEETVHCYRVELGCVDLSEVDVLQVAEHSLTTCSLQEDHRKA